MRWATRLAKAMATASAVWCVAIGFVIWVRPLAYRQFPSADPAGTIVYRSFSEVSGNGPLPLLFPVAIATAAAVAAWKAWRVAFVVLALLLAAFVVIAGFSIGAAYIPAAALLLLALVPVSFMRTHRRDGDHGT